MSKVSKIRRKLKFKIITNFESRTIQINYIIFARVKAELYCDITLDLFLLVIYVLKKFKKTSANGISFSYIPLTCRRLCISHLLLAYLNYVSNDKKVNIYRLRTPEHVCKYKEYTVGL
jgi:hypothetical protein